MSKTLLGLILPIFTEETEEIFDNNEVFRNEDLESTLFYEENQLFTSLIIGRDVTPMSTNHLVMQAAVSASFMGRKVLVVLPGGKWNRWPAGFHLMPENTPQIAKGMQFLYPTNLQELLDYGSDSLEIEDVPDTIIIQGIELLINRYQEPNEARASIKYKLLKVLAVLSGLMAQKYSTPNTNECNVDMMNLKNENSNIELVSSTESIFSNDDNDSNADDKQENTVASLDRIDEKSINESAETSNLNEVSSLNDVTSEESTLEDESTIVLNETNDEDTKQDRDNRNTSDPKVDNEEFKHKDNLENDSNQEENEIEIFKNETSINKALLKYKRNEDNAKPENGSETNGENDSENDNPQSTENASIDLKVITEDTTAKTVEELDNIAQLDGNESICSENTIEDTAAINIDKHKSEIIDDQMKDTQAVNDVEDSTPVGDDSNMLDVTEHEKTIVEELRGDITLVNEDLTYNEDISMEVEEKSERDAELIIFGQLPNLFDDPTLINQYFNEVWRLKAKKNVDFELDLVSSSHELNIKYNLTCDSYYLQKVSVKEK